MTETIGSLTTQPTPIETIVLSSDDEDDLPTHHARQSVMEREIDTEIDAMLPVGDTNKKETAKENTTCNQDQQPQGSPKHPSNNRHEEAPEQADALKDDVQVTDVPDNATEPKETKEPSLLVQSRDYIPQTTPSTPMVLKRHPIRQSRNQVSTYDDLKNSVNFDQFETDYPSSDGTDIAVSSRPKRTPKPPGSSLSHARSPKPMTVLKPLNKRRFLKTGFVYDTAMSYHATPDPMEIHPEDPHRIFKIFNIMEREGLLRECKRIKSRRATKQEILLVHNIVHYRKLRATS
ncbi:Histone deacetylase hda1, partial [Rhizopus stolonifer]